MVIDIERKKCLVVVWHMPREDADHLGEGLRGWRTPWLLHLLTPTEELLFVSANSQLLTESLYRKACLHWVHMNEQKLTWILQPLEERKDTHKSKYTYTYKWSNTHGIAPHCNEWKNLFITIAKTAKSVTSLPFVAVDRTSSSGSCLLQSNNHALRKTYPKTW